MTIPELHSRFLKSNGFSTDTRTLKKGALFFCLKGDNFNGNVFAKKAIEAGASFVIFDDLDYKPEAVNAIHVNDSLACLQALATYHRNQFDIPVIGLTGSNGKTTSKELFYSVLSQQYTVHATKGNLNNHIGVPLTLLGINNKTQIALIEMGANHQREIAFLSELAQPTMGYVTNFGKAHLEGFGGIEGVIKGKSELYDFLRVKKGKALINGNDSLQLLQSKGLDNILFGSKKDNHYQIENSLDTNDYCTALFEGMTIKSQLTGSYNFDNINAAISLGMIFSLSLEKIKQGIEAYLPTNNRSQWTKTEKNRVLLDAYNANPTSMKAAINAFASQKAIHKTVILGDMLELGDYAAAEHQSIVRLVKAANFDEIILVGPLFSSSTKEDGLHYFTTTVALKKHLQNNPIQESTVLIKGSRGIALEQLLDEL
ncbi:UDP-N-acetylmuramoyl-tripeptide--D-alanyl-D-alanine ligase [Flavobacteriaceae bacterium]|nr:UDP-N-acetylmuramoyl-tripeptide--D-alanyl-D-alanine ligase [Flavobacteriaceae bacterium]